MSFLKKTNFQKIETNKEIKPLTTNKSLTFGKKPGALSLNKKTEESSSTITPLSKKPLLKAKPKEEENNIIEKEEVIVKQPEEIEIETVVIEENIQPQETKEEAVTIENEEENVKVVNIEEELTAVKEEVITEEVKPKTKKKRNKKETIKEKKEEEIVKALEIDETKRISLDEADAVMRDIVAPTTLIWEQEKKDVLEALDKIKIEQDMTMDQVKNALVQLDELKFTILPKVHDAETMYDGTKQNYDTVKAIAISKGSGSNAEARKAEGILACQNYVTPSGQVVDLHRYMLLIEERYKFYQKIEEGISFKKYSLINYNNALKIEKQ